MSSTGAPLSHEQEQLWLLHVSQEASATTYNLGWALALDGDVDAGALGRAIERVATRHEVLRGAFVRDDERPVQRAQPAVASRLLRTVDLSGLAPGAREAALGRLREEEPRTVFRLEEGGLARAVLVRLEARRHALLWVTNELVGDRPSGGIVLAEIAAAYRGAPVLAPAEPYAEHARRQRAWVRGAQAQADFEHWRAALRGYGGVELPFERTYSLYNRWLTSEGAVLVLPWPRRLAEGLERFARAHGVEPLAVLQAAHAALVHRHSGQADLAIGVCVDGRAPEAAGAVGNFERLLPLRLDLSGDPSFGELVGRVAAASRSALEHGELPYPKIVEAAHGEGGNDQLPLLMTAVGIGAPAPEVDFGGGMRALPEALHDGTARLDITIDLEIDASTSRAVVEYSSKLFSPASVERLLERLALVLHGGLQDPGRRITELDIATPEELRLVVGEWRGPALLDLPATVLARFAQVAARTPAAIAVEDEHGAALTYAQLDRRASQLAHALADAGVRPGDRCGVAVQRDSNLPVALLGVLRAGAAYVPLDADLPSERAAVLLSDAGARALVCSGVPGARVPAGPWAPVDLEAVPDADERAHAPDVAVAPASLAYVMYTSGTTGGPKGVLIEHRSVCAFVRGAQDVYDLTAGDRFVSIASLAFDVSTFDVFGALLSGARLFVAGEETRRSVARVRQVLRERRISVYMGPPGVLELLDPADFPDLRVLAVGGEAFSGDFTTRWARGRTFVNSYGPTETTVGVITHDCEGTWDVSPPIGRPMPNHAAYVLDVRMGPVPVGVTGELYVGGPGVGRGYLGLPARTAASFVPDPFATEPDARLYRTGDLARWLPSGALVFLGRADRQIKLSGVRIEPAEIEDAVCKHPEVRSAVVVASQDEGGLGKLVAYVVPEEAAAPGVSSLRAAVASWLPPNMIPNEWVTVPEIPLSASGKVDHAALARWRGDRAGAEPAASGRERTPTEERVAREVLAPVLGIEDVGADDNFFELGGHSLQVLSVLARVRTLFGVEIRVAQFFQVPTLAGIAAAIDAGGADPVQSADRDVLLAALAQVEGVGEPTAAGRGA